MIDQPQFCRDCRWAQKFDGTGPSEDEDGEPSVISISRCLHASALVEGQTDIVTGEVIPAHYLYCSTMRFHTSPCGPEGRLFEPRSNPERR